MHLLVLSAFRLPTISENDALKQASQCTFWCSVLSDTQFAIGELALKVSMHLLVLSAFRPFSSLYGLSLTGLNAPSGAQCFPTIKLLNFSSTNGLRLNAPSGAQCFPTSDDPVAKPAFSWSQCTFWCSVLSDEYMAPGIEALVTTSLNAPSGAQCFPTRFLRRRTCRAFRSQCTFWCSVLSDLEGRPWRRSNAHVSMHLLVLSAFRLDFS